MTKSYRIGAPLNALCENSSRTPRAAAFSTAFSRGSRERRRYWTSFPLPGLNAGNRHRFEIVSFFSFVAGVRIRGGGIFSAWVNLGGGGARPSRALLFIASSQTRPYSAYLTYISPCCTALPRSTELQHLPFLFGCFSDSFTILAS